jgi:hypothetical protein
MIINDILRNTIRVRKFFTDVDVGELTDVEDLTVTISRGGTNLATFTTAATTIITREAEGVYAIRLSTANTSIFASGGSYVMHTSCNYIGDFFVSRDTLQLRA